MGSNLEKVTTRSYWPPLPPLLLSLLPSVVLVLTAPVPLLQDTGTTRSKSASVPRSTARVASPSLFSVITPGKRSYTRRNRWHSSSLQRDFYYYEIFDPSMRNIQYPIFVPTGLEQLSHPDLFVACSSSSSWLG